MAYKKKISALLVGALAFGTGAFAPATFAEGECVASNLEELEVCLADASATSIITTDTIAISGEGTNTTLIINKDVNGGAGLNVFEISDGANVTLRGTGTITAGRYGAVVEGADLTIDGVTIDATNSGCYGVYARDNGRVTIESGMVVADYAAFAGNNTTGDMNFYIDGGQLISNRYPAIYMPGQVDLRMRNGTLTGGIVARMGQIEIEGGTINLQSTPVENDGIDQNYNGMPSVANEAITLLAGSYKSTNAEHGNDMNVRISGDRTRVNGDIVLYDLGNNAVGYEQNVNVTIEDGYLTGFKTKFTTDEIGFALKNGYTAGLNNEAGRIKVELWGGSYTTEPAEEDIAPGSEAELNAETGVYEIWPTKVDYKDDYFEELYNDDYAAYIDINSELIADRKATFSAEVVEDLSRLQITGDGELIGALDLDLLDRDGARIEINDVDMTVYIDIDEETYNMLSEYDKIEIAYFDENGVEIERLEATLNIQPDEFTDPETGETTNWAYYWIEFNTTHLSTYGIVGVNGDSETAEGGEAEGSSASTPQTGTVTMAGASASIAAVFTSVVIGIMTSVVSFAYLIRRR